MALIEVDQVLNESSQVLIRFWSGYDQVSTDRVSDRLEC